MVAVTPSLTRLHGGIELRFQTRLGALSGDVVLFLPDAEAIDLGQRIIGAVLGVPDMQPICVPPIEGDDPGDCDGF